MCSILDIAVSLKSACINVLAKVGERNHYISKDARVVASNLHRSSGEFGPL